MAVDPQALAQRGKRLGIEIAGIYLARACHNNSRRAVQCSQALCKTYGAWLHVDGAFGLFAACDPARTHL